MMQSKDLIAVLLLRNWKAQSIRRPHREWVDGIGDWCRVSLQEL